MMTEISAAAGGLIYREAGFLHAGPAAAFLYVFICFYLSKKGQEPMADPKLDPTRRFIPPDTRPTAAEMTAGLADIAAAPGLMPLEKVAGDAEIDIDADITEGLRLLRKASPAELRRAANTANNKYLPLTADLLAGIARIYETQNQPAPSTIEDETAADSPAETYRADACPLVEMSAGQLFAYSKRLRENGFTKAAELIAGMADAAAEFGRDRPLCISFPGVLSPTQKKLVDTGADLIQTLLDKNADYGEVGLAPPELLPMMSADAGILIRLGDKFARLRSLMESAAGPRQADESMADTIRDLAGYCLLWLVARAEAEEPEPAPDPVENGE